MEIRIQYALVAKKRPIVLEKAAMQNAFVPVSEIVAGPHADIDLGSVVREATERSNSFQSVSVL